jgi:hypothetical protein
MPGIAFARTIGTRKDGSMAHACYLCGEQRPDRTVWHEGDTSRVRLPKRFEGPEGSANGGITAGVLGCVALHAAADPTLAI